MADDFAKPIATHKGKMFGVPVYLRFEGNPYDGDEIIHEAPIIWARHWALEPILDAAEIIFGICVYLRTMVDSDFEPMYPIKITGVV